VKESSVSVLVRLAVQRLGTTLWRNTVGRFMVIDEKTGSERWVQVGLCVGSSDYIGFTEYIVRQEDVGRKIAVFTALETKRAFGGKKSVEQNAFVKRVQSGGGIAGFVNSSESAEKLINSFGGKIEHQ
jgi:hypothetical protein